MREAQRGRRATSQRPAGARAFALERLIAIDEGGSYANLALTGIQGLEPHDRGLATELIGGVTRRRGTLDWLIARVLKGRLSNLTPALRNILRLGAYQVLWLDRVPPSAAVNECVKLAHRYGHAGVARLTNGVLRNLVRQREALLDALPPPVPDAVEALSVRYSLPRWLAERWWQDHGEAAFALGAWSIAPPQMALRVNTLRTSREAALAALETRGIAALPSGVAAEGVRLEAALDPSALPGWHDGWFYVQDEAAMLVSRLVAPRPGETVLDLGAAPGGKTTHLATLMANEGVVWAVDRSAARLDLLEANRRRLGLSNIRLHAADALDLTGLPQADRILLDAPCSGLGVLPRKPDLRWRQTPEGITALAALQGALLDEAARRLKPGGRLVYSTCTIGRTENQEVVESFLRRNPAYAPVDVRAQLPEAWRADTEGHGSMFQLRPDLHGVDGFFIAVLQRGMMGVEDAI